MSIHIVCPECQSTYTVADELRGKKARCKKCAASFLIEPEPPAAAPEPPEKRKRSEPVRERYEEDDDRPRRKKPPRERKRASAIVPLAIVGGSILTVLALLGAGIGVWKYWQSREADAAANASVNRPNPNTTTPTTSSAPAKPFWHAALPLHEGKEIAGAQRPEFGNLPEQAAEEEGAEPTPRPKSKPKEVLAAVGGQMAPDVLHKVKQATFYVRVAFADGRRGTGSAFLIDDAGTVVTNAHVLGMLEGGSKKPKQIEMFVYSGESNEKKLNAEFLGVDRRTDLALVRIPKDGLPEPLAVKSAEDLVETQPLWVSGYPLGEGLGKNVTVTACPVSSLRRDRNGELHTVQVQGDMMPGNSGGPVVDAAGNVVGVAVRVIRGSKFNFAVPGDLVTRLVNGRYGDLDVGVPYRDAGAVKMVLTVRMEDALHRVRKVAVDLWTGDDGKYRPAATREPKPRPNDGPRVTVDLPYDPKTTTAKAPALLPPLPPGKTYWLQPRFEDGAGRAYWASASPWKFPAVVEHKPALLASKPDGQERAFRLKRVTNLSMGYTLNGVYEIDATLTTKFQESRHPGPSEGMTELRRQYSGLGLDVRYNSGKPQESTLPGQLVPHLAKLKGKLRLDGDARVTGDELKPDLPKEDEGRRQHLATLHSLTQQTLNVISVPLPGKTLQPGETWTPKAARPVQPEVFDLGQAQPVSLSASYLYTGTLTRNGREEAVCELLGDITPQGREGGAEIGRISALVWIDLETGCVTRVEANWSVSFIAVMGGYSVSARDSTEIVLEEEAGQGTTP